MSWFLNLPCFQTSNQRCTKLSYFRHSISTFKITLVGHRRDASLPPRLPLIILRTLLPPLDLHPLHPLPRQPLILPLQPLLLSLHHIQLRIQRENLILRVLPKLSFLPQLRRSVLDPALELVFGVLGAQRARSLRRRAWLREWIASFAWILARRGVGRGKWVSWCLGVLGSFYLAVYRGVRSGRRDWGRARVGLGRFARLQVGLASWLLQCGRQAWYLYSISYPV
jgi:hypothetical protein